METNFLFFVLSRTPAFICNLPVKRLRTQENEQHKVSLMNGLVLSQTRKSLQYKPSVITFFVVTVLKWFIFGSVFSYFNALTLSEKKKKNRAVRFRVF